MASITGWFDPVPKGGHLRLAVHGYLPAPGDPAVRLPGLRRGDRVTLVDGRVTAVNGAAPTALAERAEFPKLGAVHPSRALALETPRASSPRTADIQRVVDLICPLGFGQRALIVSPPKAGKTIVLQAVAEMVFEHARRQVELGRDVVIVLDSLTRLARSHNTTGRSSRRTLSGGLDANALAKPKALFGAARAVPEGGSLTIIATALVETESRMDDVIFEEFKGTGNSELRLSRELADRRLYPAVDVAASGTRREELLADPPTVAAKQQLRRGLVGLPPEKAIDVLLAQLRRAKTNAELLAAVS